MELKMIGNNNRNFTHTYPLFLKILNRVNSGSSYGNLAHMFPKLELWLMKKYLNRKQIIKLTNEINEISKKVYENSQKIKEYDQVQEISKIPSKSELEIRRYDNYFFCFISTNTNVILCNYFEGGFTDDAQNNFLIACTKYEDRKCYYCSEAGYNIMNTYIPFIEYKDIYFPYEERVKASMNDEFYGAYIDSMRKYYMSTYDKDRLGDRSVINLYDKRYKFGFVEYKNTIIITTYEKINSLDEQFFNDNVGF